MRLLGHFILAITLLISQMGFGAVTCVCPESSAPLPVHQAVQKAVCPVTGEKGCACCKTEPKPHQKPDSSKLTSKSSDCKISVSQAPVAEIWSFVSADESPLAILPETVVLPRLGTLVRPTPAIHLIVPRIRPPDTTAHGLRAPPAR